MAPRVFSSRALAVALLALLAITSNRYVQQAHASTFAVNDASGLDISSSAIEKVASDKQLDANQLFAKTWHIKGNAAKNISVVDYIRLIVPGRVFITYAENSASSPSGAIGEVKVSGSSEAVVNVVEAISNNTAAGPKLVVLTTSTATEGEYLLTEIQLFTKNALRVVVTKGSADVVILEDVLYTEAVTSNATVSSSRRLSDKSSLVVEEKPKTVDETTGTTGKVFALKAASGSISDVHNIALSLGVEGRMVLAQMNPDDGDGEYVGYITVTEYQSESNASTIDQVKLVASHGSQGETLQLQSTAAKGVKGGGYDFYVEIVPSVKVTTTNLASVDVIDISDVSYNDRLGINVNGTGDVFISDASLTMDANDISLYSTGSGNLQVDVANIDVDESLYLHAWGSGNITYVGHDLASLATADVRGEGRICLAPKSQNVAIVRVPTKDTINQVSYTGKKDHAFECTKVDLPKRVPSKIGANEQAAAVSPVKGGEKSSSSSSSTSGLSCAFRGQLSASLVALLTTAAMAFTAFG